MADNRDFFTPEQVEEQVAWLRQHPPADQESQRYPGDSQLIEDLQRLYQSEQADARSLDHIWSRLESQGIEAPGPSQPSARAQANRPPSQASAPAMPARRGLSKRFLTIAAAVLLVVMVSGLVAGLVLVRQHGPSISNQPTAIPKASSTTFPGVTPTATASPTATAGPPSVTITEFSIPTAGSDPFGITAGPDGNLWFTEFQAQKIGRITPAGVITEYSLPGNNGPTSYNNPVGITAGPDGNLWFTERFKGAIGRITPDGAISIFTIPTSNGAPVYITAGPDGNLWFTEDSSNKIGRITPAGFITEFSLPTSSGQPNGNVNGIITGPDGNLWFTKPRENKIGRITPAGNVTEFPIPTDNASPPEEITAGPDGNLWFTEGAQIGRITPAGVITEFPVQSGYGISGGITTGPDENLWFVAPNGDNLVGRFTPAGVVSEFPLPTADAVPVEITAGPDGTLWFTEKAANKIGRITFGK